MTSPSIEYFCYYSFQFPLLGIFRCTLLCILRVPLIGCVLSIPVTWDFPLHHSTLCTVWGVRMLTFNSRYLGFSVAPHSFWCFCAKVSFFQFPLLGIFRCTKKDKLMHERAILLSFNSRYLGFSVAPRQRRSLRSFLPDYFQFPLLGIFRCTGDILLLAVFTWNYPFNSRYLGFSVAPVTTPHVHSVANMSFNSRYLGFSVAPWTVLGLIRRLEVVSYMIVDV